MAALDLLGLLGRERPPDLARDGAGEQAAAHPDPPVDAPAVDRHPRLVERALPREDVRVDRVDERAVEVEDERGHRRPILRDGPPARTATSGAGPAEMVGVGVGLRPTIVRELWAGLRPTPSRT